MGPKGLSRVRRRDEETKTAVSEGSFDQRSRGEEKDGTYPFVSRYSFSFPRNSREGTDIADASKPSSRVPKKSSPRSSTKLLQSGKRKVNSSQYHLEGSTRSQRRKPKHSLRKHLSISVEDRLVFDHWNLRRLEISPLHLLRQVREFRSVLLDVVLDVAIELLDLGGSVLEEGVKDDFLESNKGRNAGDQYREGKKEKKEGHTSGVIV